MTEPKKNVEDTGVGLDCGTMNFVAARRSAKKVVYSRVRDAFLDLPLDTKRMLKISKTDYVELDGKLLVIGDKAMETANLFNREARRPMSGGVIASGEVDAQQVIGLMMKQILGEPRVPKEKCCYSVPAPAVDVQGSDITYHKAILGKIIQELG
jgi:actin-like ATPase involved in cell morphogenesis